MCHDAEPGFILALYDLDGKAISGEPSGPLRSDVPNVSTGDVVVAVVGPRVSPWSLQVASHERLAVEFRRRVLVLPLVALYLPFAARPFLRGYRSPVA